MGFLTLVACGVTLCLIVVDALKTSKIRRELLLCLLRECGTEVSGRYLQQAFRDRTGTSMNGVTFYFLMNELAEAGKVSCRDGQDEGGKIRYFRAL